MTRPERLTPEVYDRVEALERFAEERGVTLLDVAIGGLLARPAMASVIAGATKPEQVRANAAAGEWQPSENDLERSASSGRLGSGRDRRRGSLSLRGYSSPTRSTTRR